MGQTFLSDIPRSPQFGDLIERRRYRHAASGRTVTIEPRGALFAVECWNPSTRELHLAVHGRYGRVAAIGRCWLADGRYLPRGEHA